MTFWIPLTDATTLNGCMYIIPRDRDPIYCDNAAQEKAEAKTGVYGEDWYEAQNVRALPAPAGSILMWDQTVHHWGSRSSWRGGEPRISCAFEFQRASAEAINQPLMDPNFLPDIETRLLLISKQLVQYGYYKELSPEHREYIKGLMRSKKLRLKDINYFQKAPIQVEGEVVVPELEVITNIEMTEGKLG